MVRKVIDPRVSLFVRVGRRLGRLRLNFDDDDAAKKKKKLFFSVLGVRDYGIWMNL